MTNYLPAQSTSTVFSAKGRKGERVECHAASGYSVGDYSAKPASTGVAPRDRQRDVILSYWESRGMAKWVKGGKGGGGRWYVRDNSTGAANYLPLAAQGDAGRGDVAEFSHTVSARNGGAWCACGLVGEAGNVNAARGDNNMRDDELSPAWRATLAAWPAYWTAHVARKASLARLAA